MMRAARHLALVIAVAAGLLGSPPGAAAFPQPAGVEYSVVTTSGIPIIPGTDFVVGSNCDDCVQTITFPFPVTFYGAQYTAASVSSNGTLQFVSGSTGGFPNFCVPDITLDTAILLFHGDLTADPGAGAGLGIFTAEVGRAPSRQFVVEWRTTRFGFPELSLNGEIVFYEDSPRISLIYGPGNELGADEASGIQMGQGSHFARFSCGTAALVPGLRVDYVPGTVVTGAGAGGGPHVRKFDGPSGTPGLSFYAFAPAFTGGVRVAVGDVNGDGIPDIIASA